MLREFASKLLTRILYYVQAFKITAKGDISLSQVSYFFDKWEIKNQVIGDDHYYLMNLEDMKTILRVNYSRLKSFVDDNYDCDDFTKVLAGILSFVAGGFAHGIVHVNTLKGKHALNFFFDDKKVLYYIEPQTNEIFKFSEGTVQKGYRPYFILI